jgi:hypothetical protein
MNEHELNRERRAQMALERLGTNDPRCFFCPCDDPLALELHHIAGRGCDDDLVIVCRNCHRRLSDWQKDHHPPEKGTPPSDRERIVHFLLGLADMFELLVKRLREFAEKLFALENQSQDQSGEAQP